MDLYFLEVILHVSRVYHTRGTGTTTDVKV